MRQKFEKVYELIKKYELNDVRNIGLMVFVVMVLAVTWSGSKAVQQNYELSKRASKIEQENAVLELENQTQKLKNEYFKTDEYKELEARRVLGRAAPGETVYIIPKSLALSKVKIPESSAKVEEAAPQTEVKESRTQTNFESWMDFFCGRRNRL